MRKLFGHKEAALVLLMGFGYAGIALALWVWLIFIITAVLYVRAG